MDEAEECAKQSLRTGPVRKEQTSHVHSKRALVNFSRKHELESKILLTASQTPRMGRERPRHMISNPNKTLAFRASVPSMHQGIFAWKKKMHEYFWAEKMHLDLEQHEDRQELMTGFFYVWLNCSFLSFSLLVHCFALKWHCGPTSASAIIVWPASSAPARSIIKRYSNSSYESWRGTKSQYQNSSPPNALCWYAISLATCVW